MKPLQKIILCSFRFVAMAVFLYFLGCWITWNWNPGQWGDDGRMVVAVFLAVGTFAMMMITS